jgi:putative heme iron utilization protein
MTGQGEAKPATSARRVARAVPKAALGTILRAADGWPYVSLVSVATDHDGAPLLLLSELSEHAKNLHAKNLKDDGRASLLFDATGEREDPLAGERVTLLGRLVRTTAPGHRARYLARHPAAAMYADFRDFAFYRMNVERAHLVAGFGRIHWIDGAEVLIAPSPALAEAEAGTLEHMNQDHRDVVQLYARQLLGLDGDSWVMTGIDPEGCDLRLDHRTARLRFDEPIANPETARAVLVRLAKRARERLAGAT